MNIKWNRTFNNEEALYDYIYVTLNRLEVRSDRELRFPKNPGGTSGITIGVGFDLKKGKHAERRGVLKAIGMQVHLLDKDDKSNLTAGEKIERSYVTKLLNAMKELVWENWTRT